MWSAWTRLCQRNVDFHDKHPTAMTVIPVVGLVGAFVGTRIIARKIAERDLNQRGINLR